MEGFIERDEMLAEINKPEILKDRPPVDVFTLRVWQQRGVIPVPVKTGKGKGEGKGSKVFYPVSAVPQIKRVIELLREKRDLERTKIILWIQGYPVDYKEVFEKATKLYKKWWFGLREVKNGEVVLSKKAELSAGRRYENRSGDRPVHKSKTFAKAGKKNGYSLFKWFLLNIIAGIDNPSEYGDIAILEDVLGYKVNDKLLALLSDMFSPYRMEELLKSNSEKELKLNYLFLSTFLNTFDILAEFPEARKMQKVFSIPPFDSSGIALVALLFDIISKREIEKSIA